MLAGRGESRVAAYPRHLPEPGWTVLSMTYELQPTVVSGLEVVDKGSPTTEHPEPLLFVHGAWHAAWCWEYFLDFFAERGYLALALSLRGHGGSATPKRLRGCSLADYVDDVESVAATLPAKPVVIGHSLDGFVVQKYLETTMRRRVCWSRRCRRGVVAASRSAICVGTRGL